MSSVIIRMDKGPAANAIFNTIYRHLRHDKAYTVNTYEVNERQYIEILDPFKNEEPRR